MMFREWNSTARRRTQTGKVDSFRFPMSVVLWILTILALSESSLAQVPPTLWTKTFGGTNIDVGYSVQQTRDGGYIIAGYTRSYGTMSGRNVWLIKTDHLGNEQWNRTYGGNADEGGYAVRQTTDGGYIFAGYTKSFGAGGSDMLLIKTDTAGNALWTQTFGGTQDDEAYDVEETLDGGYIAAGATSSFGTAGSRDVWLIKTSAVGSEVWRKNLGGFGSDGARSIQRTADGGYIITGWTYSYGPGAVGNTWLVRTDSSGNAVWNKVFGGTDVDRGYSVQQTTDRGYIITGYTASSGAGLDDMHLIKTDSAGNEQWSKTFGGSGRDYGNQVRQTMDGGYIVAGYTLSFGAGSDDVWLVKTDSLGNQRWSATYGGTASDVAYSVSQTSDGGYILVGHTLSYGAGVHDVWLIRLAPEAVQVKVRADMPGDFELYQNYPNPANPTTTISYTIPAGTQRAVSLRVYDVLGREVATLVDEAQGLGFKSVEFEGRNLPSGVYFYRLSSGNFTQIRRLLLVR
jgi:hypothetical protein